MQWGDFGNGYIDLEHSEHRWSAEGGGKQIHEVRDPKCHKERIIPICSELEGVFPRIRKIQSDNHWDNIWIFYWENEKHVTGRMTANTLQKALARRGKEAGIEGSATAYRFRRTVESGLRKQGKSGESVGHMLGHSSQVGTRFYAYDIETVPEMQKAVSKIYNAG